MGAFCAAGCVSPSFNSAGLNNFAQLSTHQGELGRYVKQQELIFRVLDEDIRDNRLQPRMSRDEIIGRYGQPLTVRRGVSGEVFVYRHPKKSRSAKAIYLYLDGDGRLLSWSQ